ncbi:hypothetical protein AGLY_002228 [Aphis glycines]|uniref:Uncharacterized protein n=1 Tax=Aphis glycines TaxID=307491 RepID=A0A6G0U2T5_APHGL|nr:hypothetical protein AGLY_002228 [Aphis glycines]
MCLAVFYNDGPRKNYILNDQLNIVFVSEYNAYCRLLENCTRKTKLSTKFMSYTPPFVVFNSIEFDYYELDTNKSNIRTQRDLMLHVTDKQDRSCSKQMCHNNIIFLIAKDHKNNDITQSIITFVSLRCTITSFPSLKITQNSEKSDECIDFTMMKVKNKHFPVVFKKISPNFDISVIFTQFKMLIYNYKFSIFLMTIKICWLPKKTRIFNTRLKNSTLSFSSNRYRENSKRHYRKNVISFFNFLRNLVTIIIYPQTIFNICNYSKNLKVGLTNYLRSESFFVYKDTYHWIQI